MTYLHTRNTVLTIAGTVAILVGLMAMLLPETFLVLKGVTPLPATALWMRETGLLLLALGGFALAARALPPSRFMISYLLINVGVQLGLLSFEAAAFYSGLLVGWSAIVPNGILHAVLAAGFLWCVLCQPRGEALSVIRATS